MNHPQDPFGQADVPPAPLTPEGPLATPAMEESIRLARAIRTEIEKAVIGQRQVIDGVLTALLAAGHVMIEGLPGLGKTLLVRALARTFGGDSARIQFTPDLMPSDIVGHVLYDIQSGAFRTRRGPVFTNLLLADEINRAPAKTQAALLEVMQEQQVTLEGQSIALPPPFMTLATQNPLEHEGTYPLPDAQLDRFLLKIHIEYPQSADEKSIVGRVAQGRVGGRLDVDAVRPVADAAAILRLQQVCAHVVTDARIVGYAVDIVRQTRRWPGIACGAGPRGGLALVRAARACALLDERDYVTPDDIKQIAIPALRHRVVLSAEAEIEGQTSDLLLGAILARVEAPRT